MDRSKWEYKKLGDCFVSIGNGATIKQIKEAMGIPITRIETLSNDVFNRDRMGYANIEDATPYSSYILNDGDILMSHINSMKFLGRAVEYKKLDNEVIIHGMNLLRLVPTSDFLSSYAVYQFTTDFFRKQIKAISHQAVNQASFNVSNLKRLNVIVPSLADQQRIVAELDCLNEMIAVKQEQLKEFDKLAQSIFYDMFGDPIKNEGSWETDIIGNVVSEKSYRGPIANKYGKVWLLNLDMVESNTGRIIDKLMVPNEKTEGSVTTFNEEYVLYSKLRPYLNKVVMPDTSGYCTTELVTLLPNKTILNRYYLTFLLRSDSFVNYICGKVAGAKMPRVSMKDFRILTIPLPPLALQQQFADKISAIEAQKELVKQSIAETQLLLDYTMDKYFG